MAAQYSVYPVIVQLAGADTAESGVLVVRNEGDAALRIRLYAMDFEQAADGSHEYSELGTHPRSCRDRLGVFPDMLSVDPGMEGRVYLRMEPAISGDICWSVVFAETPAPTRSGLRITQRIGTKVYGLAPGTEPSGELASAAVQGGGSGRSVTFEFRNTGDRPLRPEGRVEIRSLEGAVAASQEIESFSVLPGHSRRVEVEIPGGLAPGRYLAIPILDFGGDYLAGAQVAFRVR